MTDHTTGYRLRRRQHRAWLVPAILFVLAGVVNIGIAIASATVWPAVLAATLLIAAAGCVRGAIDE
jgi:hypothetical protein